MDEHKETENSSKQMYKSKDGFEIVPLRRGFDVIRPLWKLLEEVKSTTSKDCFICGGYARFCASPQMKPVEASDVDIYCEEESVFAVIKDKLEKLEFKVWHENNVSLTYEHQEEGEYAYLPTIQLIKPLHEARLVSIGDKQTILKNFDFTVIRAAILSDTEVLVDADYLHDEKHKLLRLKNIHCPVSSTLRCMKYSRKGYFLRPFECLKLFIDWQERDQDYRDKLIEFLRLASLEDGLSQVQVDELEALMRID